MPTAETEIETLANLEYKWGFISDIEADSAPPGLNEEIIRFISHKKREPQWMLDWRLKAYRHWQTMKEPPLGDGASSADRLPEDDLLLRPQGRS